MSQADEGDVAVMEPVVTTESVPKSKGDTRNKVAKQPPYNVILIDDDEHTPEYVVEMLVKLFGHSLTIAEKLTWQVHNTGRAIALTTHKELAELKCQQVLSYGADPRLAKSRGPLGCYIEPAPAA